RCPPSPRGGTRPRTVFASGTTSKETRFVSASLSSSSRRRMNRSSRGKLEFRKSRSPGAATRSLSLHENHRFGVQNDAQDERGRRGVHPRKAHVVDASRQAHPRCERPVQLVVQ